MAIVSRSKTNTAYKTVLDIIDGQRLDTIAYEEGAMHITDGGLYLHFNGSKVLLHPVAELQQEQTTVTESELLSLGDTPVEIVPAQGENKVINPISITIQRVSGGTSYTLVNNLNFEIDNNVVVSVDPSIVTNTVGIITAPPQATSLVANVGLLLTSVANLVGGTGDLVIRVVYEVIDL